MYLAMAWHHDNFDLFFNKVQVKFVYNNEAQWYYKTQFFVNPGQLKSICYLPDISSNNSLRYITAKICLFSGFFTFELTQRKTPHNAELCASFQNCSPIKQLCLDLDLSEKSCLASILLLRFLEFYAKECLKISKNQLWNSRKSVILTNLLRKTQEILVLKWMRDNYFQIDLSLNEPAW